MLTLSFMTTVQMSLAKSLQTSFTKGRVWLRKLWFKQKLMIYMSMASYFLGHFVRLILS